MKKINFTILACLVSFAVAAQSFVTSATGVFEGVNNSIEGQDYIRTAPINISGDTTFLYSEYGVVFQNRYFAMARGIYGVTQRNGVVNLIAFDVPDYITDIDFEISITNTYWFMADDMRELVAIDFKNLTVVCEKEIVAKDNGSYKSNALVCSTYDLMNISYLFLDAPTEITGDSNLLLKRNNGDRISMALYKRVK